jgi:4-oxalocrotonate tautomerase
MKAATAHSNVSPTEFTGSSTLSPLEQMPYVNIQITVGATRAQKAALVRDVTESLVRELQKKPEHIHVVVQEISEENWGFAGQLTDDWRLTQAAR